VLGNLKTVYPHISFEIVPVKTKGDELAALPLPAIGDKGLFTRELESALLAREIDFAVHSLKDVPGELLPGLTLRTTGERADHRDALVSRLGLSLAELPRGARVGTSSLRRAAQLLHLRPDLDIVPLRGNLATRLNKLDSENLDGIVLAAAGLSRLGRTERVTEYLSVSVCLPAAGQGTLAAECRADDAETLSLLAAVRHVPTELAAAAERTLLARMGGGCRAPLAALAVWERGELFLSALAASADGRRLARAAAGAAVAAPPAAEELGERVAAELAARGGAAILAGEKRERI
jgi:hydroxymethylbilane synthase